jgi:hypothetical protein
MSLNIIDNFRYLGKKFLDSRQSFDTLEQMKNCNDVPNGFVTYCNENKKRYTYDASNEPSETLGKWKVYTVSSSGGGGGNNVAMQPDIPDDEDAIWFDTDGSNTITSSDSAIINEMKEIIKALTQEIRELKARVDYLEVNGGGSRPDVPDDPDEPVIPDDGEFDILLEDGTPLLLEDDTPLQLEDQTSTTPSNEKGLLLESGKNFLLEDNTNLLLE